MSLRLLALVNVFVCPLVYAERAEACSGPACDPAGLVAPAAGTQVPADIPAVVVSGGLASAREDRPPELLGPDDAVVPAEAVLVSGNWVLTPDQPLTPATTYTIRHAGQCEGPSGNHTSSFTTLPEASLPSTLGTLVVEAQGRGPTAVPAGSMCTTEVDAAYASVRLDVDPSVAAWTPVIRWRMVVDGDHTWATTAHGRMQKRHVLEQDLLRVYALCGQEGLPQAQPGLAPGAHTLELQGFLPGHDTPFATAQAEVSLECGVDAGGCAAAGGGGGISIAAAALALLIRRSRRVYRRRC